MKTLLARCLVAAILAALLFSFCVPPTTAAPSPPGLASLSPTPAPSSDQPAQAGSYRAYLPTLLNNWRARSRAQSNTMQPGPATQELSPAAAALITAFSGSGERIVFSALPPELAHIQPGEVIVSGVSEAAPSGFLRLPGLRKRPGYLLTQGR